MSYVPLSFLVAMDEVWLSEASSEEGDIVACGVGSQPTFHVERKRWADEASESGTSTLGSDVHSCAAEFVRVRLIKVRACQAETLALCQKQFSSLH